MRRRILPFALIAASACWPSARAQETSPPTDWKGTAREAGLSKDEIERLARDKFVVTGQEALQSFSPYVSGRIPLFVTSDAVLNAYHVLFEETLRQQEEVQAASLKRFCETMWQALLTVDRHYTGDMVAVKSAKLRAQFVIGVAHHLLGGSLADAPEDLRKEIEDEAAAVTSAEGHRKPVRLGPPDPDFLGLDYVLFRPVGFYAEKPRLQRYFRAVRWLQMIPFRALQQDELLAFEILNTGTDYRVSALAGWNRFNRVLLERALLFEALGGSASELELYGFSAVDAADLPIRVDAEYHSKHRASHLEKGRRSDAKRPFRSDRLRRETRQDDAVEFRILSPYELPEDRALAKAGNLDAARHHGISPSVTYQAWLGVPLAERMLKEGGGSGHLEVLSKLRPDLTRGYDTPDELARPWWKRLAEGSYGGLQLRSAMCYLAETDPRAPEFMRSKGWQLKIMQTIAASWAQERHAWALQSMPEVHVLSGSSKPHGFTEPAPAFFLRLSWIAGTLGRLASDAEAKSDPVTPLIEEVRDHGKGLRTGAKAKPSSDDIFGEIWVAQKFLAKYSEDVPGPKDFMNPTLADLQAHADGMDRLAKRLESDARPGSELWEMVQTARIRTDVQWHKLEMLCLRLSMLADKQLNKLAFSEDEVDLIKSAGTRLSEIMLYRGQALYHPADDAPRVALLASRPADGKLQHVGIGRPRLMYVLYPWEGREVLCLGTVMPYHEVSHPTPLTDAEWRERFSGDGARPALPEWLRDLVPTKAALPKEKE